MFEENGTGGSSGLTASRKDNGKRKALIIAISNYDKQSRLRQLPFCMNDGEAIYEVLKNQKYDIPENRRLIGRVGGDAVRKTILDFLGKTAKEDDLLFLYFSGHGIPDSIGDHYLTSSDIEIEYPEENGFRFVDLQKLMTKSNAKRIVAVLDCCLAGAIRAEAKGGEAAEEAADKARGEMSKVFDNADGRCIFASSLEGQSSYPMKGSEYSLFTHHLIEGLKGGAVDDNGYVTPMSLSKYVFSKIPLARQKPITKIAMSGDIILANYPDRAKPNEEDEKSFDVLYQLIRDGSVNQFNLARKDFVDFHGRDFQRRNLQNIDLSKSNLQGVNMREANLQSADFSNSNLAGALFDFADLRNSKFKGAILEDTSFEYALLYKTEIQRATTTGPNFTGAEFRNLPIHAHAKYDEAVFDIASVPARIVKVDGYKVRYLAYENPIHGGADKETTVLLHGLIGSADGWLLMMPSLSKHLKLAIPDILGFGYSDKPPVNYDLEFFMKFLSGLLASLSIGKANIVAMSFGARLGIEFAIRFPSMVNKLVLCSPAIIPPHFDCASYAKSVINLNYKDFFTTFVDDHYYAEDIDAGKVAETSARLFADMIRQPDLQHSYESALCELERYPKLLGRLSRISSPTLVVWGENDKISRIENANQFREIPKSEFVIIKDCGHYVCLQKPIEFNKAILKFFLAHA